MVTIPSHRTTVKKMQNYHDVGVDTEGENVNNLS
jgi:hypothetical protein